MPWSSVVQLLSLSWLLASTLLGIEEQPAIYPPCIIEYTVMGFAESLVALQKERKVAPPSRAPLRLSQKQWRHETCRLFTLQMKHMHGYEPVSSRWMVMMSLSVSLCPKRGLAIPFLRTIHHRRLGRRSFQQ